MIEKAVLDYLNDKLSTSAYMEVPEDEQEKKFVVIEKTGSGVNDHVYSAVLAVQSYAPTLNEAAKLNEEVIERMKEIPNYITNIGRCELNSDYNFSSTGQKRRRYQAVFDLSYVKEV
jgi:hypothetical protein